MKKAQMIVSLLYMLAILSACKEDDKEGSIRVTAPALNSLTQSDWVLSRPQEESNPFLFRLNWSKARFSYESGEVAYTDSVVYELEADLPENEFTKPVVVATSTTLFTDIYTRELNEAITRISGEENDQPHTINLRVKTMYKGGTPIYSAAIVLTVTPYIEHPKELNKLDYVYMIGDMNGWDPNNTDYILYRNSNALTDGIYTYTGYFGKGSDGVYFKFCAEENLGGYDKMYCAGADGVLDFGDKGAFFAGPGYYTVTLDLINMTWKLEPFNASTAKSYTKIGPIGDFCGWDNEPPLTASSYDPHQWNGLINFAGSTTCKFRGNNDWANNWGGQAADLPYGKGIFDGPGANVSSPGNYRIYFNDLTGNYVIKAQ